MKIKTTPREIIDQGCWLAFCDLKGINEYALNEGTMSDTEEFELTLEEAREIGLYSDSFEVLSEAGKKGAEAGKEFRRILDNEKEQRTYQWCYNFKSPYCPMENLPTKDDCESCEKYQPIWHSPGTNMRILLLYTVSGNAVDIREIPHTDKRVLDEIWGQLTELLGTVEGKDPETLKDIMRQIHDELRHRDTRPMGVIIEHIEKILEPHIKNRWGPNDHVKRD